MKPRADVTAGEVARLPSQSEPGDLLRVVAEQIPAWTEDALCAQIDSEIFFPEKGGSTREAKAMCRRCPVAAECLDYALANNEQHGIWGGLSPRHRRHLQDTAPKETA